jgi:hypothetical protein
MLKFRREYRVALILLALCLFMLIGLFVFINIPSPASIADSTNGSSILFETSDQMLFGESDCYTVRWDVSGIKGVYLNGTGQIGQGEELLCYADVERPALRVVFEDDSEEVYALDITVIQQDPNFWIVIGLIGLLLLLSASFAIAPILGVTLASRKAILSAIFKLTVLTLITLIVVGGILEVGMRYYFTNYGTEDHRISYIYTRDEIQNQTSRLVGVPYALYLSNPDYEGHNSLGYRGAETTLEKPENTFRIVTLGASTTYGFGVNANQAYPAVLQDILHDDYGLTHVEVINGGVPGYSSFELLPNFMYRVVELEPDLIIYYGALNDAETRLEDPACFNDPTPMYGLTTYHGLWRTDFGELPSSALYRYFAVNMGIMTIPNSIEYALVDIPIAESCMADEDYTEAELLALNSSGLIHRNFRNLLALAQFNEVDVMVSEFAHPTELSQVEGDENLLMSPAKVEAVAETNALYRQISEEMGVNYYAFQDDLKIEPGMFWTTVHMKPSGTKEQARLYAQYLVDNNLIPQSESSE